MAVLPAERGGFEPPIESLIPITVFETAAFDHSATSPGEVEIVKRNS
jgi:hypothetical protein